MLTRGAAAPPMAILRDTLSYTGSTDDANDGDGVVGVSGVNVEGCDGDVDRDADVLIKRCVREHLVYSLNNTPSE
jgi:hypothetical protein